MYRALGPKLRGVWNFLLTSSFSPFSCITSISHNFWITHSFQMNDPSLESYDVLLYMCNKNLDLALFFLLTSAFFPSNLQKIVCVTSIDVMWRHNQWLSKNYRNVFRVYWYMSWPSFVPIEAFFAWLWSMKLVLTNPHFCWSLHCRHFLGLYDSWSNGCNFWTTYPLEMNDPSSVNKVLLIWFVHYLCK